MSVIYPKTESPRGYELGFSLLEVITTILLLGIVLAVATVSWSNMVQDRRVDSAVNQLTGDLQLAQDSAVNRLAPYRLVLPTTSSASYEFGPSGSTLTVRNLPDNVKVSSTTLEVVEFVPSGQVAVYISRKSTKPEEVCKPPELLVQASDGTPAYSITVDCETGAVVSKKQK